MALMAVFLILSRFMASRLNFWTTRSVVRSAKKVTRIAVSRSVKPVFDFILLL